MTENERKLALYCLKASSDYHSEVCEECINYPNCDHTIQDDVTETIIKALEQEPVLDKNYRDIINALNEAISDYLQDKETATQMEVAIDDAIRFIEYHFASEESEE